MDLAKSTMKTGTEERYEMIGTHHRSNGPRPAEIWETTVSRDR